jgi:hypothetical protein
MHTLLEWLTNERSLAVATWGLVIVTAMLVCDGWWEGREQRKRWDEEDKRREDESKPTAHVEAVVFADAATEMHVACYNLGNHSFLIDRLVALAASGMRYESDIQPVIVVPGRFVTIPFNPCDVLSSRGSDQQFTEGQIVLTLRGARDTLQTAPVWFCAEYGQPGQGCPWTLGRLSDMVPGAMVKQPKIMPPRNPMLED